MIRLYDTKIRKQADGVLNMFTLLLAQRNAHCNVGVEEGGIDISIYENCRERGYNLSRIKNNKSVSFSEYRNSDSIVVYYGNRDNFAFNTNIPDDETYAKAKYFKCEDYLGAAQSILDYLLEFDKSL